MDKNGFVYSLIKKINDYDENQIAFRYIIEDNLAYVTYKKLVEDIFIRTSYFIENNIKNKKVILSLPNSYEWIITFFSILASGNVVIPIDYKLKENEIRTIIDKTETNFLFTDNIERIGQINTNIVDIKSIQSIKKIKLDDVYNSNEDETIMLMNTSGTTGTTKIAELTSNNLLYASMNKTRIDDLLFVDDSLLELPFHHVAGLTHMLLFLWNQKTICIGRNPRLLFKDIEIFHPTSIWFVPSFLENVYKMSKSEDISNLLGSRIRYLLTAGGTCNPEICEKLIDNGLKIVNGFGMTEVSTYVMFGILDKNHLNTIGKPVAYIKPSIENEELVFSGELVIKGYYNNDLEMKKTFKNGKVYSGDLCKIDNDGNYYIYGRKKNIIILSNGENVNPEGIESFLNTDENIIESLVYSNGKVICAKIYTNNEEEAKKKVLSYNKSVVRYKRINKVEYCDKPLQKTGMGKIKRGV